MNSFKTVCTITILLFAGIFSSHSAIAQDCTNMSGRYLMGDEYDVKIIQTGCEKLMIATEVGSETIVVDAIEHTTEDYDGNLYIHKTEWNADRTSIITNKRIVILGQDLFTIRETYSLLPNGDFEYLSEDRFESGPPRTTRFVYTKK